MTGAAIAAGAIADATPRDLATEYSGPRPAGTRDPQRISPRDRIVRPTRT